MSFMPVLTFYEEMHPQCRLVCEILPQLTLSELQ